MMMNGKDPLEGVILPPLPPELGTLMVRVCPTCSIPHCRRFDIPIREYLLIQNGTLNFPESFDTDAREFMMTGICSECWDSMKKYEEALEGDAEDWTEHQQGDVAEVSVLR